MGASENFRILERVDSTNNYAMAAIHAGMAKHGMAWFAQEQSLGKGQRGKDWISRPGENIILSVVIEPPAIFLKHPFIFNAAISNACYSFLNAYIKDELKIKWPNDLYVRDRKTGGILIENIYNGKSWKWAVVGIGINVNQTHFPDSIKNPVSIKQVTGRDYDPIQLAKELYKIILDSISTTVSLPEILNSYNANLYMLNQKVKLRRQNILFETRINSVNQYGQLVTMDSVEREFEFGEVEWV